MLPFWRKDSASIYPRLMIWYIRYHTPTISPNLQLFPGAKIEKLTIQHGLHHHRNSISSYQDNVGWWLMVDLLPSEAILSLTWSAPKDYIVKNSLFKIIYFSASVLVLCYFCLCVLSVFFAIKIIASLNCAPKWKLIKSRIAIKNN